MGRTLYVYEPYKASYLFKGRILGKYSNMDAYFERYRSMNGVAIRVDEIILGD